VNNPLDGIIVAEVLVGGTVVTVTLDLTHITIARMAGRARRSVKGKSVEAGGALVVKVKP